MMLCTNGHCGHPPLLRCRIFGSLEQLLARSFGGNQPGQRDDWVEVEGNWVLRPPGGWRGGGCEGEMEV